MLSKSHAKTPQNIKGKRLYEEALRFCILNKPDHAIQLMKMSAELGYELACQALREITDIANREKAK